MPMNFRNLKLTSKPSNRLLQQNSRKKEISSPWPCHMHIEALEQRKMLAIDVAIVYDGSDTGGFSSTATQLNDDTFYDFNAAVVPTTAIDSPAELAGYDVVVIGADGLGGSNQLNDTTFANALNAWVQSQGGGVVMTGFGLFGSLASTNYKSIIDSIIPVTTNSSWGFSGGGSSNPGSVGGSFTVAASHPITDDVTSFSLGSNSARTEWANSSTALDSGATQLGTISGRLVAAAKTAGTGRGVWLGPAYAANSNGWGSLTSQLRNGPADRLLEQAVSWAAGGVQVVDVVDVTPDPTSVPVEALEVIFSGPIVPSSFDYQDITLHHSGSGSLNLIDSSVMVTMIDSTTYKISNLAPLTGLDGQYILAVTGSGISHAAGQVGGEVSDDWVFDSTPPQ